MKDNKDVQFLLDKFIGESKTKVQCWSCPSLTKKSEIEKFKDPNDGVYTVEKCFCLLKDCQITDIYEYHECEFRDG